MILCAFVEALFWNIFLAMWNHIRLNLWKEVLFKIRKKNEGVLTLKGLEICPRYAALFLRCHLKLVDASFSCKISMFYLF